MRVLLWHEKLFKDKIIFSYKKVVLNNNNEKKLHDNKTIFFVWKKKERKLLYNNIFFLGSLFFHQHCQHSNDEQNNKYDTYLLIENFYGFLFMEIFYDEMNEEIKKLMIGNENFSDLVIIEIKWCELFVSWYS